MISPLHLDALKELVNIGVGRAASCLNDMLDSPIELEVPAVTLVPFEELELHRDLEGGTFSSVQLAFCGCFAGVAALVFPPDSAIKLVAALTGEDPAKPGLDGLMAGTLNEVGNIVINSVIGSIGNILEKPFEFALPDYLEGELNELLSRASRRRPSTVLLIRTHFTVRDRHVDGNIFLVFEAASFDALLESIDRMIAA